MNDTLLEQVSSLVDDEHEQPLENNLNQLLKSAELRDTWQRYHQMGDWMRGADDGKVVRIDVVDRVRSAIDAEPAILIPVRAKAKVKEPALSTADRSSMSRTRRGWSQVAGIGIAAAVASLTVLLFQQNNFLSLDNSAAVLASSQTTLEAAAITAPTAAVQVSDAGGLGEQAPSTELSATFQQKFDAYLVSHVKRSAGNGVQGMLPYARVVNHGAPAAQSQAGVSRRGP